MHHMEAVVSIARRLNFRPKSVQRCPSRSAREHPRTCRTSDAVATRALIAAISRPGRA